MIQAGDFISACVLRNYTFFTGVPCSFLSQLINCVNQNDELNYVAATSEGEAVGIASGAYLAGRKPVVMCQNSGLGNALNPLASLNFPFRIPVLLIITLRGELGLNDEPQHELMGQITGKILDTLRIPWSFFPDNKKGINKIMNQAEREMEKSKLPFALIMRKGDVSNVDLEPASLAVSGSNKIFIEGKFKVNPKKRMLRIEAIKIIRDGFSCKDVFVATTGKIGRELFTLGDNENQLYVVGSMGCAAGIGFGIQHVNSKQGVIVLDGDGAALMKMGTIATIGHYKPRRFMHVILDNEAYESTGGQSSVSVSVDFCKIAGACGYSRCFRADTKNDLINLIKSVKKLSGPILIHIKIKNDSLSDLARPKLKPYQVKERFMMFLEKGGNNV